LYARVNRSAEPLDTALRALSDGTRRRVLHVVRERARSVGEIARLAGVSQQIASHHLSVLRTAQLVSEQRDGAKHLFRMNDDGLRVVHDYLGGFWPEHLSKLKRAAEQTAKARRRG
jgi:DNA-binding transcriptional ArsR family regulator